MDNIKREIANVMKAQRDAMSSKDVLEKTKTIHTKILNALSNTQHIAIYASFGSEIDTFSLIETWLHLKKNVYLPRVEGKIMNFYPIDSIKTLKRSRMGILEPTGTQAVDKQTIEAFVVPLLAYNDDYYRVGYGGGYYDRYLKDTYALKIGMAYHYQFTHVRFEDEYDIPLNTVMTD